MDKRRPGKVVADSSAIAAIVMEEQGWENVAEILSSNVTTSVDFAWAECANVVWKAREPQRMERLKKAMKLVDRLEATKGHLDRAMEIAVKQNIPVHDAVFIAVSEKLGASLVTRDKKQGKMAKELGIDVVLV